MRDELKRVLDIDLPVDEWAKKKASPTRIAVAHSSSVSRAIMAAKVAQWGPT